MTSDPARQHGCAHGTTVVTRILIALAVGGGLWFLVGLAVWLILGPVMARNNQRYPAAVEAPATPRRGASTGTWHSVEVTVTAHSMN